MFASYQFCKVDPHVRNRELKQREKNLGQAKVKLRLERTMALIASSLHVSFALLLPLIRWVLKVF